MKPEQLPFDVNSHHSPSQTDNIKTEHTVNDGLFLNTSFKTKQRREEPFDITRSKKTMQLNVHAVYTFDRKANDFLFRGIDVPESTITTRCR